MWLPRVLLSCLLPACLPAHGFELLFEPKPTEGYRPEFSRTVEPAQRASVEIRLDFPEHPVLERWPVTFGVPFPRGALASPDSVRLLREDGSVVPAQFERTATWHAENGDVKWLQVDFTAVRGAHYTLEYGRAVQRETPLAGNRIDASGDRILLDTGPLQVTVDTAGGSLLQTAVVDGTPVVADNPPLYITDRYGTTYLASTRPGDLEAEVEVAGPLHSVIKVSGIYRDPDGNAFCHYVVRIHGYAGHRFIRVLHTLIIAFDTQANGIRDIGIPLTMAGGPVTAAAFGMDTNDLSAWQTTPVPGAIVQPSARRFLFNDTAVEDGRAPGTVILENRHALLAAGIRFFWEDFAKSIEVTEAGLLLHLWPDRGVEPLDFNAESQLGPRYDEWGNRIYHQHWFEGGLNRYDQAFGLAKTSEIFLHFASPPTAGQRETAQASVHAIRAEPFAMAPPAWLAASDAFGPIHPFDPERFSKPEAALEAAFDHFLILRESIWNHDDHVGNYGFFDFGDVNYQLRFNAEEMRWEPRPWRRMASRFYGFPRVPWLTFARTGKREILEFAVANTRHVMDIDMAHLSNDTIDPDFPKIAGARYGDSASEAGIIHYAGRVGTIGPDSHVDPWLYAYYLTGYRRAWDVLQMEGDYYLELFRASPLLERYAHRATGGALGAMVNLWEATWNSAYLGIAQRLAERIYEAAVADPGDTVRSDDVYMNPAMIRYYQATGDARMRDLILRNMRQRKTPGIASGDSRDYTALGPAMAYYWTGDRGFLSRPLFHLHQYVRDMQLDNTAMQRGVPEGRWPMAHNTVQLHYTPYLLAALALLPSAPEPLPDISATSGGIVFRHPGDGPIEARVFWSVLSRPFHWWTPPVREWPAYAHGRRPEITFELTDRSGAVLTRETVDLSTTVALPYNTQDYPFSGTVELATGDAPRGWYGIRLATPPRVPVRLALLRPDPGTVFFPTGEAKLSHSTAWYFWVPEDCEHFAIEYKLAIFGSPLRLHIHDGEGREVAVHGPGRTPSREWEHLSFSPAPGQRGRFWRMEPRPYLPQLQDVVLRFHGLPNLVAAAMPGHPPPSFRFSPQKPEPEPLPAGMETAPTAVAGGTSLELGIAGLSGDNPAASKPPRAGSLSFWIYPEWDPTDYADAEILRMGDLRILRQIQHTTTVQLGRGQRLFTGFVLSPWNWYHLRLRWDLDGEGDERGFTLWIDDVPMARNPATDPAILESWQTDTLRVGGDHPFRIGALQWRSP